MTDEEIVRGTVPQAEVQHQAPFPGADLYYERDGFFGVYAGPGLETKLLGRGATELQAWAAAAVVTQAGG